MEVIYMNNKVHPYMKINFEISQLFFFHKRFYSPVCFITTRKRSLGQGNVFTGACHSFCPRWGGGWLPSMHHSSHDQGVCIQRGLHLGGLHPRGLPSGRLGRPPKKTYGILWDMDNKWAVRILLECILVHEADYCQFPCPVKLVSCSLFQNCV